MRIKSIDVVRGLAILLMIIVNNPGVKRGYIQLEHAMWNGVTLADFGFPFFIICMGVSIPISINNKIKKGVSNNKIIIDIIRRSAIMILFGLFLNYLSNRDLNTIRMMGVLQRLGITYLIGSLLYLGIRKLNNKNNNIVSILLSISLSIIFLYYIIAKTYGFEMEGSLAQIVDINLLNGHLYKQNFDPEGILTTIVSISSVLMGSVIGCIITDKEKLEKDKLTRMILLGITLSIGAFIFNKYFPFNKRLWSSSFVLLTGGVFSIILSVFYYICDMKKKYKTLVPIIALGSSPIFIYMMLEIISKTLWKVNILSDFNNEVVGFRAWVTYEFITPWAGDFYDSIIFSSLYAVIWIIIMLYMYRKNKFIKI
ncbi:DUF5009 domain-containing protein [Clostridium sp. CCUG 7971]|uniref:acyltransferase family protein n=1 Tax=Clostridium sp. CCUG 7971 TaxID=2811414 RepID=UPI002570A0BB|nr:DUF5009 domain-containing protein [Clostridium sp. CCUG 7971]